MKEYFLNYYKDFKCVAGKCKHTCCSGWEMKIDRKTLSDYKTLSNPFCEQLKKGVDFKKSKFKADRFGRCAFLNEQGLCDIIINLGEQSLCQVCRDHPRFRSYFDDRIETGLGFSCEQATKIILSYQDKLSLVLTTDDKKDVEPTFIQEQILKFREKALDIIQDRNLDINDRLKLLLSLCNVDFNEKDFNKILKLFLSFERLDNSWTKRLKSLKGKTFSSLTDKSLSLYAEQFLANSLFRHLSDAEDTIWARAITLSIVFSWWIIKSILESELVAENVFDQILDIVRSFSAEVEYSQKNLDKLFDFAYKFIKI